MQGRVILFLVDGMRADSINSIPTPTMDRVCTRGLSTLQARTVMPSITLPCHVSLFFSVPPTRHGILTNTWTPMARPLPGLFDVLHQQGLQTASFYNWEQLRDLSRPGSLDFSLMMSNLYESNGAGDSELADYAIKWLKSHVFDFAFIYLGQTDEIAHREGWMSKQYLKSIQNADSIMGRVMDELSGDITYFITSDHGGHDRTHGTEMKSDMTIPLLIQGSGLTSDKLLSPLVSIMDIAPSILSLFEIPKPREWEGDNFFITDDL